MCKEKTAVIFCASRQAGKLVKQLRFLVSQDITKIIIEESELKQQRDDLRDACKGLMTAWNSPNTRRSMYQLKTDMDLAYDIAEAAVRKAQ